MAQKSKTAPNPSQPTPYLKDLQTRVTANDNLIRQKRAHAADKKHILRQIEEMLLAFDKLSKKPLPDNPKECMADIKRRFFYLNYLFRFHFAMGDDAHIKYAFKAARLSLRYYKKFCRLELSSRKIDERNRQNNERNRQEDKNATMERRAETGASRETTATQTMAQIHRPENRRGQENIFSKRPETRNEIGNGQRPSPNAPGTGRNIEEFLTRHSGYHQHRDLCRVMP